MFADSTRSIYASIRLTRVVARTLPRTHTLAPLPPFRARPPSRRLATAENLFFLLDGEGYGHISFDEVCLLAAALQSCGMAPPAEAAVGLPGVVAWTLWAMRSSEGLLPGAVTLENFKAFLSGQGTRVEQLRGLMDVARAEKERRRAVLGYAHSSVWADAVQRALMRQPVAGGHYSGDGSAASVGASSLISASALTSAGHVGIDVFLALDGARCRCAAWASLAWGAAGETGGQQQQQHPQQQEGLIRALDDQQATQIWTAFSSQPQLPNIPSTLEHLMAVSRGLLLAQ